MQPIKFTDHPKKDNSNRRHAITAVIYDKRGMVLSIGQNSYIKSHPYQAMLAQRMGQHHKVFLHAEIHAITRCRDLSKAYKISVFRYNRAGEPVLAMPCEICAAAIDRAGIRFTEHT